AIGTRSRGGAHGGRRHARAGAGREAHGRVGRALRHARELHRPGVHVAVALSRRPLTRGEYRMPLAPRAPQRFGLTFSLLAACVASAVAVAQPGTAPGDWPMYSRDLAGTRFSPLDQITRDNVGRLVQAWAVPVARAADDGDEAAGPSGNPQATPIVVDGVMYLPVRGHEVLALDGATGEEIWRTALPTTEGTEARGVAYWPGDGDLGARILVMAGPTLIALEAATGAPARGFGRGGVAR